MVKYAKEYDKEIYIDNINKIINQIYKLLPLREENKEWIPTAKNIIVELTGMNEIILDQHYIFSILCKLEGLIKLNQLDNDEFMVFRSIIFDCLNLLTKLKEEVS